MTTHILKARSIDGTIYYDGYGWGPNINEAKHITEELGNNLIGLETNRNKSRELDDKIGHLELIEIPDSVKQYYKMVVYLVNGNSLEDLAKMYLDAIGKDGRANLMEEISRDDELMEILDNAERSDA